jgi:hypothetical protein
VKGRSARSARCAPRFAPVHDQAYFALMDTAMRTGEQPSMAILMRPREATLALFDAAIGQLAGKLH